jgi:hypothetical protein
MRGLASDLPFFFFPPQIQPHNLPTHGADLSEDPSSHVHIIPVSTDVVCSPVSTKKIRFQFVLEISRKTLSRPTWVSELLLYEDLPPASTQVPMVIPTLLHAQGLRLSPVPALKSKLSLLSASLFPRANPSVFGRESFFAPHVVLPADDSRSSATTVRAAALPL